MENATKALLIAAAVLVAILIISLGIVVYQMAAEAMGGVNLSEQEIAANNEKFTRYNGAHKRGSEVNAMLKTVLNSNLAAKSTGDTSKLVKVSSEGSEGITLGTSQTSVVSEAKTSELYTIKVIYGGPGGLVSEITVKEEE